jgi:hypothetical protein
MLVSILSCLRLVMKMDGCRVGATRGKRVKGSGGTLEDGAENKKAHATIAVWAGFHNKKHLAQESQRGIMRREGKHEPSCPGRYVSDCASPAAAENSSLQLISVPPTV